MVSGAVDDDVRTVTMGLRDLEHDIPYLASSAKHTLDDVEVIIKKSEEDVSDQYDGQTWSAHACAEWESEFAN